MNKIKMGILLGVVSLLPAIGSVITFYVRRGPNAEPFPALSISLIASLIGILLAGFSIWLTKSNKLKMVMGIIGLLANLFVLACGLLLLLAYGMSEA